MDRRVVITGVGGLCGLGTDATSMWKEMREGRSAIGPIANSELHDGATVGVGFTGSYATEQTYRSLLLGSAIRAELFTGVKVMPSAASVHLSLSLGLRGPVFGVTSACASANHA
ncbi:MAG: beta-ACP synthase, partial [Mesorhizobium sp.]